MSNYDIGLTVNGIDRTASVEARHTLGQLLRENLTLTGTHLACETGVCGACTVLMDGELVRACTVLAVQADGSRVETVESFGDGDEQPLMEEFISAVEELNGFQCGFCAPGIVNALRYHHRTGVTVTADEVLEGHLCRCTGYINLRASIDRVIKNPVRRGRSAK